MNNPPAPPYFPCPCSAHFDTGFHAGSKYHFTPPSIWNHARGGCGSVKRKR